MLTAMNTKKMIHLAMLTSVGLGLHIIESMIPNPFTAFAPGAKLGLANIVGLITLVIYGARYALAVNLLRSFIGGMVSGVIISTIYSMSGAFVSTLLMWFIYKFFRKYFSLIGVSVFGALGHNIAQLVVASIIINNLKIFAYLPVLTLTSIFTGVFIGITANYTLGKIKANIDHMVRS